MRYSSFPDRINVEKTSKQYFRPPLPPENQKAVGWGDRNLSAKLDGRQVDDKIE